MRHVLGLSQRRHGERRGVRRRTGVSHQLWTLAGQPPRNRPSLPGSPASRSSRTRERGQNIVEMSIALPIFLLVLFGVINGAWLMFQQQSVINASRAAAREASVLNPVFEIGSGTSCASTYGEPSTATASPAVQIENAAANVSTNVPINTSDICASSAGATSMTSVTAQSGKATITVTGSPNLATATTVSVTVSYAAKPLGPFWPAASMTISSTSTENVE